MKNIWKNVVVVIALLGASSLLSVRGAVSVYAEETATAEASAGTNAPSRKPSSDEDHPPVRIDETGVHIGGANPVDINAPQYAGDWQHGSSFATMVKAVVAICGTFGMPVAIVGIALYFKHRRNKMAYETLHAMIEKGMPITPELVAEVRSKGRGTAGGGRARSGLLPGLVLAGVGTALLISDHGQSKGGWIVLFIGIAFLIVWYAERKNQNSGQPPR